MLAGKDFMHVEGEGVRTLSGCKHTARSSSKLIVYGLDYRSETGAKAISKYILI